MPVTDPALALQAAIIARLSTDTALTVLTGAEPRVFDFVPPRTKSPYVTIGQTLERDWATGGDPATDTGAEHTLTLHVWSRANGRREAAEIAAVIRAALHDQPLTLIGHRLVNFRHEFTETRRETDGETIRGLVRFRAVTEPI